MVQFQWKDLIRYILFPLLPPKQKNAALLPVSQSLSVGWVLSTQVAHFQCCRRHVQVLCVAAAVFHHIQKLTNHELCVIFSGWFNLH